MCGVVVKVDFDLGSERLGLVEWDIARECEGCVLFVGLWLLEFVDCRPSMTWGIPSVVFVVRKQSDLREALLLNNEMYYGDSCKIGEWHKFKSVMRRDGCPVP